MQLMYIKHRPRIEKLEEGLEVFHVVKQKTINIFPKFGMCMYSHINLIFYIINVKIENIYMNLQRVQRKRD